MLRQKHHSNFYANAEVDHINAAESVQKSYLHVKTNVFLSTSLSFSSQIVTRMTQKP